MNGELSLFGLFRDEARAHTTALSAGLVELEGDPTNPQRIEPLMRAAHSIKGAARIVNVEPAVRLAHVMEDALVAAQHGRIRLIPADVDVLLRATDLLASLGGLQEDAVADWSAQHEAQVAALADQLQTITEGRSTPLPPPTTASEPAAVVAPLPPPIDIAPESVLSGEEYGIFDQFREEVRLHGLTLRDGLLALTEESSAAALGPLLQAAHLLHGAAVLVQVAPAARLCQTLQRALSAARDRGRAPTPDETARLLDVVRLLVTLIPVEEEAVGRWTEEHEEQVERLLATTKVAAPATPIPSPPPPAPREQAPAPAPVPPPASPPPPPRSPAPAPEAAATEEAVVRVTAESLNRLMSLAGESLVQARWLSPFSTALLKLRKQQEHLSGMLDSLHQAVAAGQPPEQLASVVAEVRRLAARCRSVFADRVQEFEDHAGHAEDLNSRLYREVLLSRMRPFADGAQGFPRLVRDAARRLGKQVRLILDGQATPVDRDILERLEAPLNHLLRNAVDHAIEPPDQRRAAGKPETGQIRIEARHRGGTLAITVADDGHGIDLDALRRKIVERGLTTAAVAQSLTEPELLEFLFLPGFSMSAALTEFSGRGVGLDVVQTVVRQVGGSVRIATQRGRGTAFHLQLPITLSVLRAVLVEIAGEVYALPHNRIDRLLRVPRAELRSLENCQFLLLDGQNVGLALAAQVLELPGALPDSSELCVVLVGDSGGQYGLVVDAFRGEQDLVVRPLDPRLGKVPDLSAAALLDDGAPVLIIDVEDLIRSLARFIQGHTLQRCEPTERVAGPRKRVLVVDDSITVREVERQLLRQHGYDVALAVDGQEGWNAVRGGRFDLLVTDVDMPRMNGFELVRTVRGEPALRELPVIIVSYKERDEDRLRGLEAGANYYLTKSSFHDDTFLRAVTDLIGEA